ncbi:hypothetical protein, partial [Enterococcus sp. 2F9_DIV0599]|uniref:hypothetical protein n=1 Tax=Enterococcus sp. 2F9_DIV0599 TaxID=1834172 RepID=UPI001BAE7C77
RPCSCLIHRRTSETMTTHNKIIALVEKGQEIKTLQKKHIKFFNQRKPLVKFDLRRFSAF